MESLAVRQYSPLINIYILYDDYPPTMCGLAHFSYLFVYYKVEKYIRLCSLFPPLCFFAHYI